MSKPLLNEEQLSSLLDVAIIQTSVPLTSPGELGHFEDNPYPLHQIQLRHFTVVCH